MVLGGGPVFLDRGAEELEGLPDIEVGQILHLLERKEKIIKILYTPFWGKLPGIEKNELEDFSFEAPKPPKSRDIWENEHETCFKVLLEKGFDKFVNANFSESSFQSDSFRGGGKKDGLRITFVENREIVLNDYFQLCSFHSDSIPQKIFSIVYAHPQQKFSAEDLQKKLKQSVGRNFHSVVRDWGFVMDLKKAFFEVSQGEICLKNRHIGAKDLEKLGISRIKIEIRLPKKSSVNDEI